MAEKRVPESQLQPEILHLLESFLAQTAAHRKSAHSQLAWERVEHYNLLYAALIGLMSHYSRDGIQVLIDTIAYLMKRDGQGN